MISGTRYEPDLDALRAASTRIVVAAGRESEDEFTHRAALESRNDSGPRPRSSRVTTAASSAANSASR